MDMVDMVDTVDIIMATDIIMVTLIFLIKSISDKLKRISPNAVKENSIQFINPFFVPLWFFFLFENLNKVHLYAWKTQSEFCIFKYILIIYNNSFINYYVYYHFATQIISTSGWWTHRLFFDETQNFKEEQTVKVNQTNVWRKKTVLLSIDMHFYRLELLLNLMLILC